MVAVAVRVDVGEGVNVALDTTNVGAFGVFVVVLGIVGEGVKVADGVAVAVGTTNVDVYRVAVGSGVGLESFAHPAIIKSISKRRLLLFRAIFIGNNRFHRVL